MASRKELLRQKKNSDNARARYQKSKKNILNYGNQIYTLNDHIIQLTTYINGFEKTVAKRKIDNKAKETYYHTIDGPILTNEHTTDLLESTSYGKNGTQAFLTQITKLKTAIVDDNKKIATYQKKIVDQQVILNNGRGQVVPKPVTTPAAPAATTSEGNATFSKDWKYNAPMVNSAYFTGSGGVSESLVGVTNDGNFVDAGKYQDALNAWSGTTGGRGVLQMDRKFVNQISLSQNSALALDPQMYGFKFLYNPKEIAMSWGLQDKMDPEFIASGQDAFSVISAGLISSTVEITLLLNRIGDFSYINQDGYNDGVDVSPYPETVEIEEVKEIYKKGTMYDLEYLFKTMNGPHATFISKLNGKTADRGWMRPTVVELHLGAGMRYRVRIRDMSVTHSIFNSRMVPILSSVHLVLGRFNDGPETNGATLSNPYGNNGGHYEGSRFVPNP